MDRPSTFFYSSPLCPLTFWATPKGIYKTAFKPGKTVGSGFDFSGLKQELDQYFKGRLKVFSVPLDFDRSGFTGRVLRKLRTIPFGKVISYGELAKGVGNEGAARAVGTVMSNNQIPLLIPCHRVVKSDRSIGEFSGGPGLKEKLLSHEGKILLNNTIQ